MIHILWFIGEVGVLACLSRKRSRVLFIELTEREVYVILSNSSAELVYELYEPYAKTILEVGATRMINSNAQKRGKINELLITNFHDIL